LQKLTITELAKLFYCMRKMLLNRKTCNYVNLLVLFKIHNISDPKKKGHSLLADA